MTGRDWVYCLSIAVLGYFFFLHIQHEELCFYIYPVQRQNSLSVLAGARWRTLGLCCLFSQLDKVIGIHFDLAFKPGANCDLWLGLLGITIHWVCYWLPWAVCSISHMSPGCSQPRCFQTLLLNSSEGELRPCAFYLSPSPTLILPITGLLFHFLPQDIDYRSTVHFSSPFTHSVFLLTRLGWVQNPKFRLKPTGALVSHASLQTQLESWACKTSPLSKELQREECLRASKYHIYTWSEEGEEEHPTGPFLRGPTADTGPLATLTTQKETEDGAQRSPAPRLFTGVWDLISDAIPGRKLERAQARKGAFTPSPSHLQWLNKQNKQGISRAKLDNVLYGFLASSWQLLHHELSTQVAYSLRHICPLEMGILGDSTLPQSNS